MQAAFVRREQAVQFAGRYAGRRVGIVYSCVTIAWHIGRKGLGHQQVRVSEIRPKRASS